MNTQAYALFDTALGHCGIAWGGQGVLGVQLPENGATNTRARLCERYPDAREATPPPRVQHAVTGIVALLRGELADMSRVALDMQHVPPFHRRVYELARTIAPGMTVSYGEIADRLGSPGAARAVGQALRRNPFAIIVPCHRVLAAGGKIGGFTANGGIATKLRMLAIEGRRPDAAAFEGDGKLGFDPLAAVEHLRAVEPALARVIDEIGPMRLQLQTTPSIFVALAEAIVYQQLSGKAAATIHARVCGLFPRAHEGPTPQQMLRASDEKLRGAGLSRAKAMALRDLAQKTIDGTIPTLAQVQRMEDDEIVMRLTDVRGIGRWTAQMLLIARLGRPDVLPVDDYGVRKGYAIAFRKRELPSPKDLAKRGERWRPFRTAASWYLWRVLDQPL